MAKASGLGAALWVSGYDVSNDIGSIGKISGGPAALDVTGIDKSAYERIGGLRDGGIDYTAWFNPTTAPGAHGVFSSLPTSDVLETVVLAPAISAPCASMVAKQINYDPTRGQDGSLSFAVTSQANGYGLEWGILGTPGKRTDTAATNGAAIDNAASSAFGLQAYLHVFSFTGTSCTVKLQDSPDNSVWTDVTGGGFTAATGVTSQRIATASGLSIARYLRVVTTGTFNPCTFAVQITRNATAVVF